MMEMKKYKLGDCLSMIRNGANIKQREGAGGIPITRIETLSGDEFHRDRLGYADVYNIDSYTNHILQDNDILMSHINSRTYLGRSVQYHKKDDEVIIHGMNLLRIQTKDDILDCNYAYYFFQSPYFKRCVDNRRTDAVNQSSINITNICDIKIDLPSLPEQKRIASVLSALDKKIALNRQINQNLEALARQLYDYWFVQFDFPNEEGKPYKSSGGKMVYNPILKREIPEGWHSGNLYEIAKFSNGLACQKYRPESNEKSLRVIKIREMHEGFSKDTEFVTSNIPEAVKVYNGDVLFSWSASLEVMLWAKGEGGLNQHIFKVTARNDFPRSFYYYQLLNYVSLFKLMAEARKTTMGHITQDHLEQSRIAIPDSKEITYQLEGKLAPIFDAIINNESEITSLIKQRDELLPLLMNGQVNFDLSDD